MDDFWQYHYLKITKRQNDKMGDSFSIRPQCLYQNYAWNEFTRNVKKKQKKQTASGTT